jgi:hypothetical protein
MLLRGQQTIESRIAFEAFQLCELHEALTAVAALHSTFQGRQSLLVSVAERQDVPEVHGYHRRTNAISNRVSLCINTTLLNVS